MEIAGAICFGIVIGWVTYRTLRRKDGTGLSDIAGVIGALGGAAITKLFGSKELFAAYCIGLAIGFFAYLVVALVMDKKTTGTTTATTKWMEK
ncbi:MAG: hypothetical protein EOP49_20745 [Sphingobacteriales bacterium]|nr:MAG: hypothetical protein EOP49_20745 [Sphingobacteriales bacterium]